MTKMRNRGFTLVELMLSMAFVSLLLLAIATVAIQAGQIYNRSIAMTDVNKAGRIINDTLRRDFLQANANNIVMQESLPDAHHKKHGRLCLGQYSYIWNYAPTLDNPTGHDIVHLSSRQPVNFVRVLDRGGEYCRNGSKTVNINDGTQQLLEATPGVGNTALALHNMTVTKITQGANQEEHLYRISFTVGTSKIDEIIAGSGCKPPADRRANDFCAVNKFETIVRANG